MGLTWNAAAIEGRIRQGALQGVAEGIGIVEQRAVALIMNPPKTGRIYKRRGVEHQASAPGEAPASDTGTLVNARHTDLIPDQLAARLTFTARHALWLERGTRKMAPRPFAGRALMETKDDVENAIARNAAMSLMGTPTVALLPAPGKV